MPLYKVQELFGQRLSPPTVRIKAYSDQEVKVIGSIIIYMCTSEKTDRVIWQVTKTTGVPILGRTQEKHMNYISYPKIHVPKDQEQSPVSADSLKSTDYVYVMLPGSGEDPKLQSTPKMPPTEEAGLPTESS